MREFRGRVVAISGAAGGLGRALCLRFAAAGARIVALDRDAPALVRLETELRALGAEAIATACDVTNEDECTRALDRAVRSLGALDVLVANAGITHRSAFERTKPEVIRRVMQVNFFGAVHCTHAALPHLVARRGMIVAISSVAGFAPLVARTGYAASKHALHGFFDSLRTEIEPQGVRVLLVCPSFIRTGIEAGALAGDGSPVTHRQSIVGERSTPEAIAQAIFEAATREKRLLLPDTVSRRAWWAMRLAPRYYERRMLRALAAELSAGATPPA